MSHERPEYRKTPPDTLSIAEYQQIISSGETEHKLHVKCVKWFKLAYPQIMLKGDGNAASRTKGERGRLIGEGMVPGWPDIQIAYPHNGKSGLFCELKTTARHSKPSPAQIKVQAYLRSVGYEVAMPRTFDEFQQVVNEYLQGY